MTLYSKMFHSSAVQAGRGQNEFALAHTTYVCMLINKVVALCLDSITERERESERERAALIKQ